MEMSYKPYFDPEFESLFERMYPPSVCIDNDTYQDCTIVKVDSKNKQGILLEMVQVLTDLDLVISKSYICSDGGWFMDVFHVNDQFGNKITEQSLINYIQEAMCASRRRMSEVQTRISSDLTRPHHVSMDHTALEMTGTDRPGLISEISAVLADLGCHVSAAAAWTHNTRIALILYLTDESDGQPITDPNRVGHVQSQLETVVEAHHGKGERRSVAVAIPAAIPTHTERRLHQLMAADGDYEECCCAICRDNADVNDCDIAKWHDGTKVTIDTCEKGYSIVTVKSKDRPKLLFDTVCTLTDMQYVVFHAAISSKDSIAFQEYYVRQKNGCILNSDDEKHRITRCLIAAIERRISNGLRLDVSTENRVGLLSDITRVLRESSLTIARAEIGTRGEKAVGSFYVKDVSGQTVSPDTVEAVRKQIGGTVLVASGKSTVWSKNESSTASSKSTSNSSSSTSSRSNSGLGDERPRLSLGNLLWSQLERLSSNFKLINS